MESFQSQSPSSAPVTFRIPRAHREHVDASCTTLTLLAEYIPQWGMNKTAREVAGTLCGYFDVEFRHHREEQESALFPALVKRARGEDRAAVQHLVERFTAEHVAIEQAWKQLRATLSDIAVCRPVKLSIDEVSRFATLYRDHAGEEDRQLIALGGRILGLADDMAFGVRHDH